MEALWACPRTSPSTPRGAGEERGGFKLRPGYLPPWLSSPWVSPKGAYRPDKHSFPHLLVGVPWCPSTATFASPKEGAGPSTGLCFSSMGSPPPSSKSRQQPGPGLQVSERIQSSKQPQEARPRSSLFAGERSGPVAASTAVSTRPRGLGGKRPVGLSSVFRALARSLRVSAFPEVEKRPERFHPLEITPEEPEELP